MTVIKVFRSSQTVLILVQTALLQFLVLIFDACVCLLSVRLVDILACFLSKVALQAHSRTINFVKKIMIFP